MARNWNNRQADKRRTLYVYEAGDNFPATIMQGMTKKTAARIKAQQEKQGARVMRGKGGK